MDKIPLVDLGAQHAALKPELDQALADCLSRSSFIGGPDHAALAEEFAAFCGGGHAALCGNGTDALTLAILELLGPGDGDGEIVTVAHTFIATVEAIVQAGYRPVLVDVDPETRVMDPAAARAAVTPKTKAILPVHLYGRMVPMDAVMTLADEFGLKVIEDAAQAHGAKWQGKGPGQWGHAACFSFFPGKNLGCWGDGGAVFTRDPDLARRIRTLANHGRATKYSHDRLGVNSRLDGLQAAILRVKLRHLAGFNQARRDAAAIYDELLSGIPGLKTPGLDPEAEQVFHLYVVELDQAWMRDAVLAGLHERGVMAGVHYPQPLHLQPALAHLGMEPDDLPHTARLAGRILSLPIYPEITRAQIERCAEALAAAVKDVAGGVEGKVGAA